jgi:hypothetical protein
MRGMAKTFTIDYTPYAKQYEFHNCPADEALFGGAAGPGKSRALRMEGVKVCLLYPGMHAILFRRTYPELEMEIIRKIQEEVPQDLYKYNDQKKRMVFRNGSVLQFGYCERAADIIRYQGAEFGWIGWDELTHFEEYPYLYMLSRLRTTDLRAWPRVRATTNPGGIGHAWVKKRFIDPAPWGKVWRPQQTAEEAALGITPGARCFIFASYKDGPYANDKRYLARLMQLPEAERRALMSGDWDVFAGQVFAEFRRDVHVVRPEDYPILSHYRRVRWMDWGFSANTACLWVAFGEVAGIPRLIIYREHVQNQRTPTQIASEVLALSGADEIDHTIIDSAVWDPATTGEVIGETMAAAGLYTIPADKGPGSRIQAKQRLHEWLTPFTGPDGRLTSRLLIYDSCPITIQEIPTLTRDKTKVEDVDDNSGATGHADVYAAIRYGLLSRPAPGEAPPIKQESEDTQERILQREAAWLERMNENEGREPKRKGYW